MQPDMAGFVFEICHIRLPLHVGNYGLKAGMPITQVNAVSRGASANGRADLQDAK